MIKTLTITLCLLFSMGFTHPFAREGSVNNDSDLLEERIRRAERNRVQHQEALELIEEEKQKQEDYEDGEAYELRRKKMNSAEKLVE